MFLFDQINESESESDQIDQIDYTSAHIVSIFAFILCHLIIIT